MFDLDGSSVVSRAYKADQTSLSNETTIPINLDKQHTRLTSIQHPNPTHIPHPNKPTHPKPHITDPPLPSKTTHRAPHLRCPHDSFEQTTCSTIVPPAQRQHVQRLHHVQGRAGRDVLPSGEAHRRPGRTWSWKARAGGRTRIVGTGSLVKSGFAAAGPV
jgi:hypothetical protein